jgi:hypothetical protein
VQPFVLLVNRRCSGMNIGVTLKCCDAKAPAMQIMNMVNLLVIHSVDTRRVLLIVFFCPEQVYVIFELNNLRK